MALARPRTIQNADLVCRDGSDGECQRNHNANLAQFDRNTRTSTIPQVTFQHINQLLDHFTADKDSKLLYLIEVMSSRGR